MGIAVAVLIFLFLGQLFIQTVADFIIYGTKRKKIAKSAGGACYISGYLVLVKFN